MPKKFVGENSKATTARARKAEVKRAENERIDAEKEDASWADDDKYVQRKMRRKDDAEQKKQQQIEKKLANKKAYDEEVELVCSSSKASVNQPAKITRAQIEQERALETLKKNEEEALEQQKNVTLPNEDLAENVNRLSVEGESASGIDEALQILGKKSSVEDKNPEKRLRAAYQSFEDRRLSQLKQEHPTFRLSQLKQLLKKEWQKSPDNPLNQNIMDIIR